MSIFRRSKEGSTIEVEGTLYVKDEDRDNLWRVKAEMERARVKAEREKPIFVRPPKPCSFWAKQPLRQITVRIRKKDGSFGYEKHKATCVIRSDDGCLVVRIEEAKENWFWYEYVNQPSGLHLPTGKWVQAGDQSRTIKEVTYARCEWVRFEDGGIIDDQ